MPVSPARAFAFDILLQVESQGAYASELLHAVRNQAISTQDHGLATELVMGVLRWRSVLDEAVAEVSSMPLRKLDREVLTALRLAVYQIRFLDRIPRRAAVHESVDLVKRARKGSAAPFVNAVLRQVARPELKSGAPAFAANTPQELARQTAHPLWMVERWASAFNILTAGRICEYNQRIPETAIRIFDAAALTGLKQEGVEPNASDLLTSGFRVRSGDVRGTKTFEKGQVAIQDEGSQLVGLLAGRGKRILDCCAAPGGKTRILATRNPGAEIVAVELHEHRARLLRNLVPSPNVRVINADVTVMAVAERFDCVLVDVPCSGTGTLARNPDIKWRLQPGDLSDLRAHQITILRAAMKQVAPGGRLVYSTCSLEREENTSVVEEAVGEDRSFQTLDCDAELRHLVEEGEIMPGDFSDLTTGVYLQTIPGMRPCDGFFAAVLRRD